MGIVQAFRELFVQAGAAWVLWLLLGLSAMSMAVGIERLLFFRKKTGNLRHLIGQLDAALSAGQRDAALALLTPLPSVAAAVARAGLRLAPRGAKAAEKSMESALVLERKALERRLAFLGTLGNNAPFVGLFGTVIGVVLAFNALGNQANQAATEQVMGAIAEALVATAVGIGVALPAVVFYNYFQRRIAGMVADAVALSSLVLAYLVDEGPA